MNLTVKTAATLLATSMFVGLGATAAFADNPTADAAGSAQHAVGQASYTRGFHIDNLSGDRLRLTTIGRARSDIENNPADGTIIPPGRSMLLEMTWIYMQDTFVDPRFDVLDDAGNVVGELDVTLSVDGSLGTIGSASTVQSGKFTTSQNNGQDHVYLDDPAGTVRTVNGDQAQLQAHLLQEACGDGALGSCTFNATGQTQIAGPSHVLVSETNNGANIADLSATKEDEVVSSDSVEIATTVKTGILDIVDAEISSKYSHTWSTSHLFSTGVTNHVSPYSVGEITSQAPMLRVTGEFHARLGNTTINLDGVYFDSPDADGAEHFGYDEHKLNPAQRASLPTGTTIHSF